MRRIVTGSVVLFILACWPLLAAPDECLYDIHGEDGAGRIVLRTVGYALDRAGLLAAPLHVLQQGGRRWSSLRLVSPGDDGARESGRGSIPVNQVALIDAEHNLAILRVPALVVCGAGVGAPPEKGARLTGLRGRRGYGATLFQAKVERSVTLPGGVTVMRAAFPDGSGAPAGFLFDGDDRLVGSILPSPPDADRFRIAAVDLSSPAIAAAAEAPGRPLGSIRHADVVTVRDTTTMLMARALTVDRRASPETILARLEAVEERTGEFAGLLLERGAAQFDRGDLAAAIADFRAAVAADPDEHLAHYNLGISLGADGRYNAAAEAFRQALLLKPEHPRTLYHLAVALAAANRPAEAVGPYTDLSRVDPALAADLKALIGL
jgi:hypothetical protein